MKSYNTVSKLAIISIAVIIAFMPLFSILLQTNIFALNKVYAINNTTKFADTNVLDDLKSSTVEGKSFDITDYPYNELDKPRIINFVEYCYSFMSNLRDNYGLYIYVYNPSNINFDIKSKQNTIQLATGYNDEKAPNIYEKFNLQFCNKSNESSYKNLFYKFKIIDRVSEHDNKTIATRVNSHERRYDVSGFELLTSGASLPNDYNVGGTYSFSGYVQGYGQDQNDPSTLQSKVNELETISLNVESTYFRTGVSAEGKGHQNQLNSVYFSVPNDILNKYGKLQIINAEWWEYRTEMIGITNRSEYYKAYLPYVGDYITYNSNIPFRMYTKTVNHNNAFNEYWYPFNVKPTLVPNEFHNQINVMPFWFFANESNLQNYTLGKEELYSYILDYTRADSGYLPIKDETISADLFSDNIDSGRIRGYNNAHINSDDEFDMLSYDSAVDDVPIWWQKFKDYGFFSPPNTGGDFLNVSPILEINPQKHLSGDISKNLLIQKNDVDNFKNYVDNSSKKNETTILFRFAMSDYFCDGAWIVRDWEIDFDRDAFLAYETVFLNFDIISLTFNKEGKYSVIPVVSNPIDIVGDITPPIIGGFGTGGLNWNMIILFICVVLLVLITLPLIFKLVTKKDNDVEIVIKNDRK